MKLSFSLLQCKTMQIGFLTTLIKRITFITGSTVNMQLKKDLSLSKTWTDWAVTSQK